MESITTKIAGTAMIAGALGAASLGLGTGSAQADPGWGPDIAVWILRPGDWVQLGSGSQLGPARTGQEMVPLALPHPRSLDWGSTRDTLYLDSLEFPCDASSCDDPRAPARRGIDDRGTARHAAGSDRHPRVGPPAR